MKKEKIEKKKIKYNFIQEFRCEKCHMEANKPGPCEKCSCNYFNVIVKAQEIK